jgi:DNA-binding MltR family transcriptional regulator
MSNGLAKDLFDKGPLGTFSAKIDLARAMGILDEAAQSDLRAIKAVRNVFAHAENPVRFTSPEVLAKAQRLALWRDGADARMLFDAAVERSEAAIDEKIHALLYEHAISD